MRCASCGYESPAGCRFCGMCGVSLSAPAATGVGERRLVTILFADISGFTAMSERLDPEAVQDIVARVFGRLTAAITTYGGTVDKYLGDGIMAVFGAPVSLGDDAERAVRAGLAMQAGMSELSDDLRRRRGIALAMRVGINTGRVIWGPLGDPNKLTVLGDAVNLASRIEHVAPVGAVLIGHQTQQHVQHAFTLEALEPLHVKGKSMPVRIFRVAGESGSADAGARRNWRRTPFVGREREMASVRTRVDAMRAGDAGGVVTLRGVPGAGKSRFAAEIRELAVESGIARRLVARAASFGSGGPFGPWTELLRAAADIAGAAPPQAREKLRSWLASVAPGASLDVRWLDELADVPDLEDREVIRRREQPAAFRQGLRDSILALGRGLAAGGETVFLAEDLHWWPAPSLELLLALGEVARDSRLLVVATTRPEAIAVPWPAHPGDPVVDLAPLDLAAIHALARAILDDEVPRGLVERLKASSDGNPLFAEEMIQAYIDHGALRTSAERAGWIWDERRATALALPDTVEGVTQARIDALPDTEKRVLQKAAVAGHVFWNGLLAAMDEPEADRSLDELVRRELVYERRSRLPGQRELAFKHVTTESVAYENVLRRDRAGHHGRVADWLSARTSGVNLAPAIATHYLKAEEPRKALPPLLLAAEEAVRAFARLEEAALVELAVKTATELHDVRSLASSLRLRGRLRRIASHPETESDLRRAIELWHSTGEAAGAASAGRDLGGLLIVRGRLADAEEVARRTHADAVAGEAVPEEIDALNQLALIALRRGDPETALQKFQEALERANAAGATDRVGLLLISMGNFYVQAERWAEAAEALERAGSYEVSRENEAIRQSNLGAALLELGRGEESLRVLEGALELSRRIGFRVLEAEALVRAGAAEAAGGRREAGLARLERGLVLAREVQANEPLVEGLLRRADLERDVAPDRARRALEEARAAATSEGDAGALRRIEARLSALRVATG